MIQAPASISSAASERAKTSEKNIDYVLKSLKSGRPLDCEKDLSRKISRIQAVTGLNRATSEKLAEYKVGADKVGLAGEARLGAERIQGKTTDFVGVSFLDLARTAANSVARVVKTRLQPLATGFMISDRLFLTNNHVIRNAKSAANLLAEFNYELNVSNNPKVASRFVFDPDRFFLASPEDDLDFTVIAIGEQRAGSMPLSSFGFCPLLSSDDKHTVGEFVNIIQHPDGDYKQLAIRENLIIFRFDTVLHYAADTNPGSSGSPVFNDQWEAIALHHWGTPFLKTQTPDGKPISEVNEGVRVSAIVAKLRELAPTLPAGQRQLLDAVLNIDTRQPMISREAAAPPLPVFVAPPAEPEPEPPLRQSRSLTPERQDNSITWTIPVQITVSLGDQIGKPVFMAPSAPRPDPAGADAEAITIDRNYSNRNGYNRSFLPGFAVDLPKLKKNLEAGRAPLINPGPGADPFELKYQHFSIVMNAKRRMAFFTAVNIDGATSMGLNRSEQESLNEGAEATEVWFDDPRIADDAQCAQNLYDAQKPKRVFDRGHLVRRLDPVWGTAVRAKRANADSFHFTNCTPQQMDFNERTEYWQGIEKYVLDNAKAEREKVTVFTGPVFRDDDPEYRYVRVPMQLWKILVRVENGRLRATALIASQVERIKSLPESMRESFGELGKVAQYQTTIKNIEQLTSLNFGELRNNDTFKPGPEAIVPAEIKDWNDVSL